jgi:hypothetical protein
MGVDTLPGGYIRGRIRKLDKPDRPAHVDLSDPQRPCLLVTRNGMTDALPLSPSVAEELIASGAFGHGS